MAEIVLFQGDSITDGCRSDDGFHHIGTAYPLLVAARMGLDHPNEYTFINRGISGNRIVDLYARLKCDIINIKPDCMSLLIGVNDIWHDIVHQNGLTPQKFKKVYKLLLEELREALPSMRLILMEPFVFHGPLSDSTPDLPDRFDRLVSGVREVRAAVRELAQEFALDCIPLQDIFDTYRKTLPDSCFTPDGIHPSPMGHQIIADAWLRCFYKTKG